MVGAKRFRKRWIVYVEAGRAVVSRVRDVVADVVVSSGKGVPGD